MYEGRASDAAVVRLSVFIFIITINYVDCMGKAKKFALDIRDTITEEIHGEEA